MNSLEIVNNEGKKIGTVDPSPKWKDIKKAPQAVKDSVVYYLANQRSGTASTKTRSEVNFSTRKPWRQKGTGRARIGSAGSPVWRKGGIVFGPKPRSFSKKLPKKVRQLALKNVLADKVKNHQVTIIDDIKLAVPKTKKIRELITNLKSERKTLIVLQNTDRNVHLSIRNLPDVLWSRVMDLNTYIVLRQERIVITNEAWKELEKRMLS